MAVPRRLDRMIDFINEQPMPELTCPELKEWEEHFDETMGIGERELL